MLIMTTKVDKRKLFLAAAAIIAAIAALVLHWCFWGVEKLPSPPPP